jgi:hypothetical protein
MRLEIDGDGRRHDVASVGSVCAMEARGGVRRKILRGAKPADLPIAQPTTYQLAVNVKTVHTLGLAIPPHVAAQVTEWVQ